MSIVISFLLGAAIGFLASWFVWKNNKKRWEKLEAKYGKAEDFYEKVRADYFNNIKKD
jgi:hypothetical protein